MLPKGTLTEAYLEPCQTVITKFLWADSKRLKDKNYGLVAREN